MSLTSSEKTVIKQAVFIIEQTYKREDLLANYPSVVADYFRIRFGASEREVFAVLFLDNQHQLIVCEIMFQGTINAATVYPREVAKKALQHNAAAVILAHNHPSGNTVPSHADRVLTNRLVEALGLLEVRVLDHIIVSPQSSYSMAEQGDL